MDWTVIGCREEKLGKFSSTELNCCKSSELKLDKTPTVSVTPRSIPGLAIWLHKRLLIVQNQSCNDNLLSRLLPVHPGLFRKNWDSVCTFWMSHHVYRAALTKASQHSHYVTFLSVCHPVLFANICCHGRTTVELLRKWPKWTGWWPFVQHSFDCNQNKALITDTVGNIIHIVFLNRSSVGYGCCSIYD